MDGRMALKRPRDEKTALSYGDWFHSNIYRQTTQPFSTAVSCKKSFTKAEKELEATSINEAVAFTGSLAEVYEKALNNVLNIQPNFKMDEKQNEISSAKKPLAAIDTPQHHSTGTHAPHTRSNLLQHKLHDDKKLNATSKSAFHVPEKRRMPNGQSRYGNWSHDHPFPYPINYPGDYYPVIRPPPIYPRYDNLYLERFNYYPGPRRRDFPVFTHVLPWLQFERDYNPMTSPRYGEYRQKGNLGYDTRRDTKTDVMQHQIRPRPLSRDEKTADEDHSKSADGETRKEQSMRNGEKRDKSPTQNDMYNVKTRRMRAVEKRNDLSTSYNRKDNFGSPKEEFLFNLGLTRVEKYHEG